MKRLTGSIMFAFIALLLVTAPVSAGRQWCAKDPVVTLNGTAVQILVAVPDGYELAVNGPIDVRIALPKGVAAEVVYLDAGFNGHGEVVRFMTLDGAEVAADGTFPARVTASVPVSQTALGSLGLPHGLVPLQVIVNTNGGLEWESGVPNVAGGETLLVEGLSNGVDVRFIVQGS